MIPIGEGAPLENGSYVVWVNEYLENRYAQRKLMFWGGNYWSYPFSDQRYREHVYQWAGPLPALELTD